MVHFTLVAIVYFPLLKLRVVIYTYHFRISCIFHYCQIFTNDVFFTGKFVLKTNSLLAFYTEKLVENRISATKLCILHYVFLTMFFKLWGPVYFSLDNYNNAFYLSYVFSLIFSSFLYSLLGKLGRVFYTSFENGRQCIFD